jgi:phosphoglycerol transferase MdoB-like AlkP superfamily enzyme
MINEEDMNKLNQLDRIELRQELIEIKQEINFNQINLNFIFIVTTIMLIFLIGIRILEIPVSSLFIKGSLIFLFVCSILLTCQYFYLISIKDNQIYKKYFKIEPKKKK